MIWWYLVRCGCASGINVVNLRAFYAREVIGYVLPLPELPWGFNRVFKYIGFYAVGVLLAGRETRIVDRKIRTGMVAIVLLIVNFFLSCYHLTMEIMWFVTALIGVAAVILISQLINENRILQYFGRISLII